MKINRLFALANNSDALNKINAEFNSAGFNMSADGTDHMVFLVQSIANSVLTPSVTIDSSVTFSEVDGKIHAFQNGNFWKPETFSFNEICSTELSVEVCNLLKEFNFSKTAIAKVCFHLLKRIIVGRSSLFQALYNPSHAD